MPARQLFMLSALSLFLVACTKPDVDPAASESSGDVQAPAATDAYSFANSDEYRVRHLELDLDVDFDRKVLEGEAILTLERLTTDSPSLILDTRDLEILAVQAGNAEQLQATEFAFGDSDEYLGTPLIIDLPEAADRVAIRYRTSPGASGLQWLEPQQTAGKRQPFLFTQAQAIHARSFVPVQDSPAVRMTYSATLRVPPGLTAVMSANNSSEVASDGVYRFDMPQPIPAYLLAIAVGELEFRAMGKRTGVYAEKEILEAAAAEFSDTESMLEITEDVYGPYQWDRYDLLILPPSFPFGGMENPRLSFITPTVIAGDKSLVALIAHELAHSWSGNLVTNASWADLWLNEGFTTYLTNRIMQYVYGDERYQMEMSLGYADLQAAIAVTEDSEQLLAVEAAGQDPDDLLSDVPYEKGSLFLYELEQTIGREDFDEFLKGYFSQFAFRSVSTADFVAYLEQTLLVTHGESLDADRINEWINSPGLPANAPQPQSDAFTKLDPVRQGWLAGGSAADIETDDWTYHQWKYFLDGMPEQLTPEQLAELDSTFELTASTNNEIAFSWLRIAIRNHYEIAYPRLDVFLTSIGRNKFLMPLYQGLMDSGETEMAARIFENAKAGYHPLTVKRNSQIIYPEPDA